MFYFILFLIWNIADCLPVNNRQQSIQHDQQLMHIVQEMMQKHENYHQPKVNSWEEMQPAASSMPCSNEEIINGANYDYYLQYVDMNDNFENIDHIDITDPMMYGCRPVLYCAHAKYQPYMPVQGYWHDYAEQRNDCFVLTQNGKTSYENYQHRKPDKQHNKTTTTITTVPTTSTTSQTSSTDIVGMTKSYYEHPRHMYIAVHNNINMGGNERIYSPIYKTSTNTFRTTTPIYDTTTQNQTLPHNTSSTTTEATTVHNTTSSTTKAVPVTTTMSTPYSNDTKNCTSEYPAHFPEDQHKSHMKFLLDFLASFRKKLCKDPYNATSETSTQAHCTAAQANTTQPMTATTETIFENTTTTCIPLCSTENKTLNYDPVVFVIRKNAKYGNGTRCISEYNAHPGHTCKNNTLKDKEQVAAENDSFELKKEGASKIYEINNLQANGKFYNVTYPRAEENVGSINANYTPTAISARSRHNYGYRNTGHTYKNYRRPIYPVEPIRQPYIIKSEPYKTVRMPQARRLNTPPRTYYWNNIVRRQYGKGSNNNQYPIQFLRDISLENCDSESMNQSKLESIDCDEQQQKTAERSRESKDYRDYMQHDLRSPQTNNKKSTT